MTVDATHRVRSPHPARSIVGLAVALLLVVSGAVALTVTRASAEPTDLASVQATLEKLNADADVAVEDLLEGKIKLKKIDQQLDELKARTGDAERELANRRAQLGKRAAYAYRHGPGNDVGAFLDTDDPANAVERVQALDRLADRDGQLMDNVQASQAEVTGLINDLQAAQREQKAEVDRLATRKADLDVKVTETEKLVARFREARRLANVPARPATQAPEAEEPGTPDDPGPPPPPVSKSPAPSGGAAAAIAYARRQLGKTYVYGAAGPNTFDCSGLTMRAWQQGGVSLPHSSRMQINVGRRVSRSEVRPGDLLFRGYGGSISHVGMYIGGGQAIAAPHTGAVVRIQNAFTDRDIGYSRPNG